MSIKRQHSEYKEVTASLPNKANGQHRLRELWLCFCGAPRSCMFTLFISWFSRSQSILRRSQRSSEENAVHSMGKGTENAAILYTSIMLDMRIVVRCTWLMQAYRYTRL